LCQLSLYILSKTLITAKQTTNTYLKQKDKEGKLCGQRKRKRDCRRSKKLRDIHQPLQQSEYY